MTDLELLQQSVDRSTRQIAVYQAKLEAIQKNYGIPESVFDELKYLAVVHEFWVNRLSFLERQICEELRQEAVCPPPGGE